MIDMNESMIEIVCSCTKIKYEDNFCDLNFRKLIYKLPFFYSEEQLKRREEVIQLQQSKQQRADVELAQLRQVGFKKQSENRLWRKNSFFLSCTNANKRNLLCSR